LGIEPEFSDINQENLCIDAKGIDDFKTKKTEAVLSTHVYGNCSDLDELESYCKQNNLKLIFDGAHCFGVQYKGKSILERGDISVTSFHATKLFHTIEGGAIITDDDNLAHKCRYMLDFGHKGAMDFYGEGINGKMSEMHAAMGLCILPEISDIINERKKVVDLYDDKLSLMIEKPVFNEDLSRNYTYYPILLKNESVLLNICKALEKHQVFPRRYFFPSLNTLNYVQSVSMPIAEDISRRVLCLPLFPGLGEDIISQICESINANI
jgi:dTDP-4-amino-4,6-dideoxygalactose transaminase